MILHVLDRCLLHLALDTLAGGPPGLRAALIEHSPSGARVAAATDAEMERLAIEFADSLAGVRTSSITATGADRLPWALQSELRTFGLRTVYLCEVPGPERSTTYTLFACTPLTDVGTAGSDHQGIVEGVVERLEGARRLATITLLRAHHDHLVVEHALTHDAATGLANRSGLAHRFDEATAMDEPVALLYIDLDHFKPVNDAYGHDFGDQVIATVVERMLRSVDRDGLVARVGGDEFAVLVRGDSARAAAALRLAERIVVDLTRPITFDLRSVSISASVGVAAEQPRLPVQRLMAIADAAMYQAKRHGGGCVRLAPTTCTV